MIELLVLIVSFIFLSGLLAMIDAAVLSVTHAEVEEMVQKGKRGSRALQTLSRHITRSLVIIVIITNLINVLGPILVGQKAIELYSSSIIGVITAVLTFGTIIFSEVIPKSLGAHYAPIIARVAAPPILALIGILYPLVWLLEKMANLFKTGRRAIGTEDQIRALVSIGHSAGYIESDEGQLIHRAFILNDKTAADIMSPLKDIVSVSSDFTIRKAADKVFQHTHSRYPVFGNSIHEVRGIVMSFDILEALAEGKDDTPVMKIVRDALVVKAEMRSDELLILFRDRHIHLAVVQEKGKTVGLVTLEDVLEELVGEIEDEMDVEENN